MQLEEKENVLVECNKHETTQELENTHYYLQFDNEIDLGLKEDTDYILVKTDDDEFKFCELQSDGKNSEFEEFRIQSKNMNAPIKPSSREKLPNSECRDQKNNKEESSEQALLSRVELEIPNTALIPGIPEISLLDKGEIMHSVERMEVQQMQIPTTFTLYTQQPSPQSYLHTNVNTAAIQKQKIGNEIPLRPNLSHNINGNVNRINRLYSDLNFKPSIPRKRGRPRKCVPQQKFIPTLRPMSLKSTMYGISSTRPIYPSTIPTPLYSSTTPTSIYPSTTPTPIYPSTKATPICQSTTEMRIEDTSPIMAMENILKRPVDIRLNERDVVTKSFHQPWKSGNGSSLLGYREYQKIQDKNRRSRIKEACQMFRTIVPGITRRTDSTSVWEQSVQYIHFIKQQIGNHYDAEFLRY